MNEQDDLFATVERLRREDFPELPKRMVEDVLKIESDHVEDRGPAPRLVETAIDKYVKGS